MDAIKAAATNIIAAQASAKSATKAEGDAQAQRVSSRRLRENVADSKQPNANRSNGNRNKDGTDHGRGRYVDIVI